MNDYHKAWTRTGRVKHHVQHFVIVIFGILAICLFLGFLNPCLDVYAEEVSGESEEEVTIVPRDWEKYSSPYIYDQLNADEKAI
nr:hypothetical protein [Eubacterium sp.]